MKKMYTYDTEIGKISIVDDDGAILEIQLNSVKHKLIDGYISEETPLIKEAYNQLQEYFSGKRKVFTLRSVENAKNVLEIIQKHIENAKGDSSF